MARLEYGFRPRAGRAARLRRAARRRSASSKTDPARVAVEVTREFEGSKFVQTVRLAAGDAGNRVEFANSIDWKELASNVKATFPLTASNPNATYNWDIGTIQRPNADERQFEVASHQWIDLTDQSGSYGATILTDVKNGSDKPDDHTIRLTLMRTPGGTTSIHRPVQPGLGPSRNPVRHRRPRGRLARRRRPIGRAIG